jgi:hypothetical protein
MARDARWLEEQLSIALETISSQRCKREPKMKPINVQCPVCGTAISHYTITTITTQAFEILTGNKSLQSMSVENSCSNKNCRAVFSRVVSEKEKENQ